MTKGQGRAGTQTLHISSSPISQCTSQDPLGRGGRGRGGGGREREKQKEEKESELSASSPLHTGIASLILLAAKWKNKWQRGDKVNKKMACKITGIYSVSEEERGGEQPAIVPDFKQLDSSHAEATFPRSYLPYGLPRSDDLLGEEKHTDQFYCVSLHRKPVVSITKFRCI